MLTTGSQEDIDNRIRLLDGLSARAIAVVLASPEAVARVHQAIRGESLHVQWDESQQTAGRAAG